MKTRLLLAALLLAPVGCTSTTLRHGFPGGFDEELSTAVQIKAAPPDGTKLLASVDDEITKRLDQDKDTLIDAAIADYEKQRAKESTVIKRPDNCEAQVEDFQSRREEDSHIRQKFQGEVTKFRFLLKDVKARILTDPSRIEVNMICREDLWAPDDTDPFSRLFRAEVRNQITKTIYEVAKGLDTDPVAPRIGPVE